jgi:transcriptional regulator with XRE-family HTH domain
MKRHENADVIEMTQGCRWNIILTFFNFDFMITGGRIRSARLVRGMTQQELADASSLTLRTIQRIEADEVSPSSHSLRSIGMVLGQDFLSHEVVLKKPYSFEVNFKIDDMNQFIHDLKILIRNNWKVLLIIFIIVYVITNYSDIKSGILDGWKDAGR